ncbi:putative EF-hand domain pair protein [Plasmopara halstedii]
MYRSVAYISSVMSTRVQHGLKLHTDRRDDKLSASRLRERLAARNGPRHSVYWVHRKEGEVTPSSYTNVMEATNMAASIDKVEYTMLGKYTGDWKDGQKHGYGALVYANGNKYEGEWVMNRREGHGIYWINEKKRLRKQYSGEWSHDQRNGRGTLFYKNDGKYEGDIMMNKRHGRGRMVYGEDQSVYDGEWKNNERSGRGTHYLANGDRYEGQWLNDMKEGPGRYFYKATRKVYEGEWINGAPKCGIYYDDTKCDDETENYNTFQLPNLELVCPDQVLNNSITSIRQNYGCELSDNLTDVVNTPQNLLFSEFDSDGVKFDDQMLRVIQHEFAVLLAAENSNYEVSNDCISCAHLSKLIKALQFDVSDEELDEFLLEIGATEDTLVSLNECVDILSLLMESQEVVDDINITKK